MRAEILTVGGEAFVSGRLDAYTSTCLLLAEGNRVGLIDPGHIVAVAPLERALSERSLSPQDISFIILTHFHLDHAFNTVFFPNATVFLHESALKKPFDRFGPLQGPAYEMVRDMWKEIVELKGGEKLFEGKVEVFYTPWHSSDHVSLLIHSENMGRVLYPGDIIHRQIVWHEVRKGLRQGEIRQFFERVRDMVDVVVFTHDEPLWLR